MHKLSQGFYALQIKILLVLNPAIFFNKINQLDWYRKTLRKWVDSNGFTPKSKVLEIGCATGILTDYISRSSGFPTGIDLSGEMIKFAKANHPNIPFQVADVNNLPFKNESFDFVISASLINIVPDKNRALIEMVRVCKKGGKVSILVPLKGFTDSELNHLQDATEITGFSQSALNAWHKHAPKMSIDEMNQHLLKMDLKTDQPQKYLNRMVFSITATKV